MNYRSTQRHPGRALRTTSHHLQRLSVLVAYSQDTEWMMQVYGQSPSWPCSFQNKQWQQVWESDPQPAVMGERGGYWVGMCYMFHPKKIDGTCSQKVNLSFKIGENYSTRINLHTTANHKLTFVIYNELQRRAEIGLDLHRFIMVPFKHGPQGSNLL